MPLKLSDGMSTTGPPVVDGHHRPFAKRMREGQQFTVLTKFEVRHPRYHQDARTQNYFSGRIISGKQP